MSFVLHVGAETCIYLLSVSLSQKCCCVTYTILYVSGRHLNDIHGHFLGITSVVEDIDSMNINCFSMLFIHSFRLK